MQKILAIVGLAVAFAAGSALSAVAQFPCYGGGFGGYGSGYGGYSYYVGSDRPPFYAMHPPVYYSYPVPRPYGYSPFAYPPGTMTPEILGDVVGSTISNPYVTPQTPAVPKDLPAPPKAKESSNHVTNNDHLQRIKVVSNPFMTLEGE